ncbi:MAG: hypothetical protein ACRCXZ_06100, partial [Patescibacteria group bacterium]
YIGGVPRAWVPYDESGGGPYPLYLREISKNNLNAFPENDKYKPMIVNRFEDLEACDIIIYGNPIVKYKGYSYGHTGVLVSRSGDNYSMFEQNSNGDAPNTRAIVKTRSKSEFNAGIRYVKK